MNAAEKDVETCLRAGWIFHQSKCVWVCVRVCVCVGMCVGACVWGGGGWGCVRVCVCVCRGGGGVGVCV